MQLICESSLLEDYLCEQEIVNYAHPLIQETIRDLPAPVPSEIERIKRAFKFVRDLIHHSGDIQSPQVTCTASEVLYFGEGLCYAKSHLLAALLRAQDIPCGFCYQRLMIGRTPEMGYALHGLNAVYLQSQARWVRLDARGNKPGIQAEFSIETEQLAYTVQPAMQEIDYPTIYTRPHPKIVKALREHTNCLDLCQYFLPDHL